MVIRYMKVVWHHNFDSDPVLLLSEIVDGWEVRKIERFRDGTTNFAGPVENSGDTLLSEAMMPTPEDLNEDPEFSAESIDPAEFETEWAAAQRRKPRKTLRFPGLGRRWLRLR